MPPRFRKIIKKEAGKPASFLIATLFKIHHQYADHYDPEGLESGVIRKVKHASVFVGDLKIIPLGRGRKNRFL